MNSITCLTERPPYGIATVVKLKEEELFEEHKGESETIAGFVLEVAKGFPRRGEKVIFNQYQFVVESIDKKRLKQIKVTLPHET